MTRALWAAVFACILLAWLSAAPIQSGSGDDQATVDTNGNLLVGPGPSTRRTYELESQGVGGLINFGGVQPPASGMKLVRLCFTVPSNSTSTAGASQVRLHRLSGELAWADPAKTKQGSEDPSEPSTFHMAKFDPADDNTPLTIGIIGGGTQGAILDQWWWQSGEQSVGGLADFATTHAPHCREWGKVGEKPPTATGTTEGFQIVLSASSPLNMSIVVIIE